MQAAQNWIDARVQALCDITPTVREFTLLPAAGALAHAPGSHLQVQILVGPQVIASESHRRKTISRSTWPRRSRFALRNLWQQWPFRAAGVSREGAAPSA